MIDQIRTHIEERLAELRTEADKLEAALAKLGPRNGNPARGTRARTATATGTSARTATGSTKAKVLETLSSDRGMTAGEVATATGLGRASVSTTLSKLAKSGEVTKAERGYSLHASN